jgi:hypothetical protein
VSLTLKAALLEVRGGDIVVILSDLREHLARISAGEAAPDPPVSLLLEPPFSAESLTAGGVSLEAHGQTVASLMELRITGPLGRGTPAPSARTELDGLDAAVPALRLAEQCFPALMRAGTVPGSLAARPPLLDVALETGYDAGSASLAVRELNVTAAGLFAFSASAAFSRAGPEFLEELRATPFARPCGLLSGPAAEELALESLTAAYTDLGLVRGLVAIATGVQAPTPVPREPGAAGIALADGQGPAGNAAAGGAPEDGQGPAGNAPAGGATADGPGPAGNAPAGGAPEDGQGPAGNAPGGGAPADGQGPPGEAAAGASGDGRLASAKEAMAARLGILALYRLDPFALNAPEIADEISRFIADPQSLAVTVTPAAPLPLGTVRPGLVDPLSDGDYPNALREVSGFLSRLVTGISSNGRPELEVAWRDVPPPFIGGPVPGPSKPPLEAPEIPDDPD